MSKHLTASSTIPPKSAGTRASLDDSKEALRVRKILWVINILIAKLLDWEKVLQGLYSVTIMPGSLLLALSHTADIFPAIVWQFRPRPFVLRFHRWASLPLLSVLLCWRRKLDRRKILWCTKSGHHFNGAQIQRGWYQWPSHCRRIKYFFCDGEDRAEAKGAPPVGNVDFVGVIVTEEAL